MQGQRLGGGVSHAGQPLLQASRVSLGVGGGGGVSCGQRGGEFLQHMQLLQHIMMQVLPHLHHAVVGVTGFKVHVLPATPPSRSAYVIPAEI